MDFSGAMSAFSHIPIDWIVIGVFFVIVVADALRSGSIRACALALSFPVSSFLFQMVPQTALLGPLAAQFSNVTEQAILFAIIEVVVFVCLHQMLFSYDRYSSLISAIVAGLSATAVILVFWTQMPALQSLWHFDPAIQAVFGGSYRFFWLVASYLALAFVGS